MHEAALRDAVTALAVVARELDADGLRGPDAAALFEVAVGGERALAAIKTLLAKRVDETGSYRSDGSQSAVAWIAEKSGSTFTAAQNTLAVGVRLHGQPEVSDAFRAGELSLDQAKVVVDAAAAVPDAATDLIRYAKRHTVKGLREKATRVKCGAITDDAEWVARLRRSRFHRRWTADDGAGCGEYRLEPEAAAKVWAVLDGLEEDIFAEARRRDPKDREPRQAYAADALVALADGRVPRRVAPLQVVVDGDSAELRGVGPVPMATAAALTAGVAVREVRRDGIHLEGIESFDRHLPADLRRWLEHRYPTCGVKGCDRDQHLEVDHVIPLSEGGTTSRDNLWRLCPYHHDRKTYDRWQVSGSPHRWSLKPPDGSGHDPP